MGTSPFYLQSPGSICRAVGARVRQLRLAHNLSQASLAQMCGASLSSVRRLEASGQGTLELVVRAALALNATSGFEALFAPPMQSIAQAEAAARAATRQRARSPTRAAGAGKGPLA